MLYEKLCPTSQWDVGQSSGLQEFWCFFFQKTHPWSQLYGLWVAVPTRKGTCGIWNCLRLDENQRISVLAGLSWSLLERIHKLTSTTHAETLFWSSEASEGAETHRSACHPHKGENAGGTALLVAADLQCKELTLVAPQTKVTKLKWAVTWYCYTEQTACDQWDRTETNPAGYP